MNEIILKITGLTKHYGRITAINQLDLEVHKGSVFGLLGPNGSGKSTTLGILLGVTQKDSGEYEWFSQKPEASQRKKIGAILESPTFYPYLSGIQNLRVVCKIKDVHDSRIEEVLKQVGLFERGNSPFKTYSLGMKQRLAIASALLSDPEVLILDEPTNGLDPQGIAEIRELILTIADSGKTIILASHLLDEVQKVCSHFAVLKNGKKIFSGSVAESLSGNDGVEISSGDLARLEQLAQDFSGVKQIRKNNLSRLEVQFENHVDIINFHEYLIENGIVLNHLAYINKSLEKQFLELLSA
ncbi:ATP-binding cassette domain-containing protein [Marivirga sp. S37H4]|uniref:ATP-binding cassette domain-containing protein n=1 Tax=Marivirga aurantiaca TaxID=2802615 RepID=A0A934WZR7_9BACT|nr:ATP-binding cassette domain-containing protein [Marivirga aurantiaca]MBK6266014.1 ATP-binding cassette domain-containing protein [Marivirga aurantiaca]